MKVGISDLGIYIPAPIMNLETLYDIRTSQDPTLQRRLRRAIDATGQKAIRFPQPWEDSATIAAQSSLELLKRNPAVLQRLRYLATGTESSVDQSKPTAAYLQGMLHAAGLEVPETLMTFQSQHACAGGTIALLSVAAMLAMSPERRESGLVVSSDVARYDAPSTAEITQGAGGVSILVENSPRLMELDLDTQGLCSRDVDDFFRPNGSVTAKVKGGYSIQCYNESLAVAFEDHCRRRGETPRDVLLNTDMFILHVPFKMMALTALQRLVTRHTGIHGEELNSFLADRGFQKSLEPSAQIGNLYTASTLLALAFLLWERYQQFGSTIVGKRFLFASYGSGNTMIIISGRIAEGAAEVIGSWDLNPVLGSAEQANLELYETWLSAPHSNDRLAELFSESDIPPDHFYLAGIRDDGYRQYAFKNG